jgi:putative hydrolase of the HAD superfamily
LTSQRLKVGTAAPKAGSFLPMIWFDLDDTLFDHSYSVGLGIASVRAQYPAFMRREIPELVRLYNDALNEVYPGYLLGQFDFAEMRRLKLNRFLSLAGIEQGEGPETAVFHGIYDEGYHSERRATQGSAEALHRLQHEGYGIAVLTNGVQSVQEEKLRHIGFDFLVPNLLSSERAGAPKPDPAIFRWALQQTQRGPESVIMIGDNPLNDIQGALNSGIRALYYCPGSRKSALTTPAGSARVISAWEQIPDCLDTPQSDSLPAGMLQG